MPNIEVAPPKYLQIAQHIREQIIRGDLAPGAEVPSERQIAAEWNVSRPTATRALEALRREGMVTSVVGSGTFVRDVQANRRPLHRYNRFRQRGAQYGPGSRWTSSIPTSAMRLTTWRMLCASPQVNAP